MKSLLAKVFLFLVGLVLPSVHFAQGGWKKKYPLANSLTSVCRNVIEAPNGNLIMIGLTFDTIQNPGTNRLTIVGTDPQGNMLWRKDYGRYTFEYLDNILAAEGALVADQNNFYHTTSVRDSNNKYIGVIIKFDYNGDTIWQKIYRDPSQDLVPQGICKSVDGGLLITGFFQNWSNNTNPVLLLKTDINGNELWRKAINKPAPNVHDGHSPVQDSATKRIIVVGYQYIGPNSDTHSNILVLDSLGNTILQTTFNNAGAGGFGKLVQLKDKNFITCGALNANSDFGGLARYKSLVVKFDSNANVIWSKTYDTISRFTGIGFASEQENGDILLFGGIDTSDNHNVAGPIKIKLYRVDMNGNLISKKYIGSSYTYTDSEYPRSIYPTSDGGIILSTNLVRSPSVPARPYSIIKIDGTGCDTLEAFCKWQESLGMTDLYRLRGFDVAVFPNPATNFIKVKVDAQQEMQFAISVSDETGRELQISASRGGDTKSINTSEFAPGIYFLVIKQNQYVLRREKFVVVR